MNEENESTLPAFVIMAVAGICILIIGLVVTVFSIEQIQKIAANTIAYFFGAARQTDSSYAAVCNKNAVSVQAPFSTTVNCIADNGIMYLPDNQIPSIFQFFAIQPTYQNAVFIQTPNTQIKDNTSLSWSVNTTSPGTLYLMTRHIPGISAPAWIRNNYNRLTNDDMSQVTQYFKRKNNQGLIGIYDIYAKDVNSGQINLQGASDAQSPAYSMYITVLALQSATATSNPTATTNPTNTPVPTGPPGEQKGYIVTNNELRQRKQLADQGQEPYKSAYGPVISYANNMLNQNPSPQQPLNIPGTTGPFVDDSNAANGLAIAYGLTNDTRYAAKAKEFIMAWVNTTKSTSNTCPDSGGCQTSLIIGRMAPNFVFAADLIKPSGVLSAAEDTAFKNWLRTVILPTASVRTNNWGDAGTQMRVVVTDYIGDQSGLNSAIAKFKSMVDLTASDGHIPEETRRGTGGITYSSGAIGFRVTVAKVMERRGIDLWSYGRFKLSADYMSRYILNPSAWPWASGAGTNAHAWWELAYAKWREPAYIPIIKSKRPFGVYENTPLEFSTMTNGVPLP